VFPRVPCRLRLGPLGSLLDVIDHLETASEAKYGFHGLRGGFYVITDHPVKILEAPVTVCMVLEGTSPEVF
jgi:hypothetical protein